MTFSARVFLCDSSGQRRSRCCRTHIPLLIGTAGELGIQRVFALCDEEDFLALLQSAAEREEESVNWNKRMWRLKPGLGDRRPRRRENRHENRGNTSLLPFVRPFAD